MYETLKCPNCGCDIQFQPVKMDEKSYKEDKEVSMDDAKKMPLNELRDKLPKKEEE